MKSSRKGESTPTATPAAVSEEEVQSVISAFFDDQSKITPEDLLEAKDEESASSSSSASPPSSLFSSNASFYEGWTATPRLITAKTQSSIYRCHAEMVTHNEEDKSNKKPMIKVKIIGQSFLLHQIRVMMSACMLCTKDILPDYFVDMALTVPIFFRLPLAPAEGLVLTNAGFYGPYAEQRIAMSIQSSSNYSNRIEGGLHAGAISKDWILMSEEEYNKSNVFLAKKIYPAMSQDWYKNDGQLITNTLQEFSRYKLPVDIQEAWSKLHAEHQEELKLTEQNQVNREYDRIMKTINALHFATYENIPSIETTMSKKMVQLKDRFPHRAFLPTSLSTILTVHYEAYPSEVIVQATRILASRIIRDDSYLPTPDVVSDVPREFINRINKEIMSLILTQGRIDNRNIVKTKFDGLKLWVNTYQHEISKLFVTW